MAALTSTLTSFARGIVVAPGSGTILATLNPTMIPKQGWYHLSFYIGYAFGIPATAEQNTADGTFSYTFDNVTFSRIIVPAVVGIYGPFNHTVFFNGTTYPEVYAGVTGTAGVGYFADLFATPISLSAAQAGWLPTS